jgi:YD repeat-containing protein
MGYGTNDSIGNLTYKSDVGTMQYGSGAGPHALTYAGGCYYNYDANGNMIKGRNKEMAYDPENRLIKVTEGSKITEFTYDGDGGRVKKLTRGLSPTGTVPEESTIYIGSLYEVQTVEHLRRSKPSLLFEIR